MTFKEVRFLRQWLDAVNTIRITPENSEDTAILRHEKSKNVITTFYPYEFLGNTEKHKGGSGGDEDADFNFFRHFIFLRTTERDARALVTSRDNLEYLISLRVYHDTDGQPAIVPDALMADFINACIRHRGTFRIIPPVSSIGVKDRVRVGIGPFAGQEASVTKVHKGRNGITLELSIPLVNGAVSIRMDNVRRHQVTILDADATDAIRHDFIDYTQKPLLSVLANRVNRVQDRERCRADIERLNTLYRYRNYEVEGETAQTHFLALMLICAHLCKDTTGEEELKVKALERLAAINAKSESRAATDTRTYLWIALYIATGQTDYSRLAKQYVQQHQPKSRHLRRFVSLIRKGRKV